MPYIGVLNLSFAIDAPDNVAALNPAQVSRFTLRQTPIPASAVPEPSTLLLLLGGLLALVCRGRALEVV